MCFWCFIQLGQSTPNSFDTDKKYHKNRNIFVLFCFSKYIKNHAKFLSPIFQN